MFSQDDPSGSLRVRVHGSGEERTLSADGEIDVSTVDHLREALALALEQHPSVLFVDLQDVTFMDSTGVVSLLSAYRTAAGQGCRVVLILGASPARRVLEVSGVLRALDVQEPHGDDRHNHGGR